jgi:hypothetical protein
MTSQRVPSNSSKAIFPKTNTTCYVNVKNTKTGASNICSVNINVPAQVVPTPPTPPMPPVPPVPPVHPNPVVINNVPTIFGPIANASTIINDSFNRTYTNIAVNQPVVSSQPIITAPNVPSTIVYTQEVPLIQTVKTPVKLTSVPYTGFEDNM